MAETLISPGVLASEKDQSQISSTPVQAGAAIIGPTVKGQVEIPKLVTSYSEYVAQFGSSFESGSDEYSYFTSISTYNYFQNGGKSLLVTRVASGSFTPASSTLIPTSKVDPTATQQTGSMLMKITPFSASIKADVDLTTTFNLNGINVNFTGSAPSTNTSTDIYIPMDGRTVTQMADDVTLHVNNSQSSYTVWTGISASKIATSSSFHSKAGYAPHITNAYYATSASVTYYINGINTTTAGFQDALGTLSANAFTLETLGQGVKMNSSNTTYYNTGSSGVTPFPGSANTGSNNMLQSGSKENIRWEIVSPNTSSGVFSVVIRRGDDTNKKKSVLETFTNVSLDPKASNYIARQIGDMTKTKAGSGTDLYLQTSGSYPNASNYVRVKNVNLKTPDYLDNAGSAKAKYTSSIPIASSGAFASGTGELFYKGSTQDGYYNLIGNSNTQGINASDYTDSINLLGNKDDFRYNSISVPGLIYSEGNHATPINTLISNTENRGDNIIILDMALYNASMASVIDTAKSLDTSYAATYWPWLRITDPTTKQLVWVPASTMIPGVYAYSDNVGERWFAPAGKNRGGLNTVRQAERKLTNANRDDLYTGKVNPIATLARSGVVVFGQKTLQSKASALDRVNVRRLLITLKNFISQIADKLVFEQNTQSTRNNFLSQVNPYLESVQQRQGVYGFKVVMDESNNTPDVIDRNQLIGAIYIQPTKTAEFIYLDFNILPTGATFPV
jgi:hypothetical protein